ncbi:ABC transporter permease [Treponema sp.]|uniref:ABC transporter permease n=1 Tax=Treponema sp. TaxID=166 RepID=UPI003F103A20
MNLQACLLYSRKLFFSRARDRDSSMGRRSLAGAVACVGISLVPLVVLLVVSNGMVQGMTSRMIKLFSQDIQVSVFRDSAYLNSCTDFSEMAESFLDVQGVKAVFPEVRGMALAAGKNYRSGAFVRGIPQDLFLTNSSFSSLFKVVEGSTRLTERTAVIGEKISEQLGLHVGDNIKIITVNTAGKRFIPKVAQFTVGGIISSGYQALDALWVFVPIDSAFALLSKSSLGFFVGIETEDSFSSQLSSITENVGRFVSFDDELDGSEVLTWKQVNESELENFASTKALLVVIMVMIVIVASINVSSSVLIIAMERKKEIALLKCIGGSPGGISFSFVLTGMLIGLAGVLIGIPCGLLISMNINEIIGGIEQLVNFIENFSSYFSSGNVSAGKFHLLDPAYYLQEIPVKIPGKELTAVAVCAVALSTLVSLIPSVKAGREKPIDTLRKV